MLVSVPIKILIYVFLVSSMGSIGLQVSIKDRVSGIGGQATWWAVKDKLALVGKFVQEYGAEDRLEGQFGVVNVLWIF